MKKIILLLDADKRSMLSILRSIGQVGRYKIVTAGKNRLDMGRFSKYSEHFYLYPDPLKNTAGFIDALLKILNEISPDYICPCSDPTMLLIYESQIYDTFKDRLLLPDRGSYLKTCDKRLMSRIARTLNIKVPNEIDIMEINKSSFPLVIKPRHSWYQTREGTLLRGFRSFVDDLDSFNKTMEQIKPFDSNPLIQEIIKGQGYGIFVAAKEGEIFASFAHERLREVPPGGGVSTLRRSVQVNQHLLEASKKLIEALNWTGIAMVEFKGTSTENAYFMEINGRPWGSLDLAVSSGLDFPKIMVDLFINKLDTEQLSAKYSGNYTINHCSHWILGEINYLRYVILSNKTFREKLHEILNMFKYRPVKTSYDTFRLNDPIPFFAECLGIVSNRIRK